MTDTVLTSEEIVKLVCATDAQGRDQRFAYASFARAVEAAVLAKQRESGIVGYTDGKVLTEREARLRERAAYLKGWTDREGVTEPRYYPHNRLDDRYPLLNCDKCGQTLP